MTKHYIVMAGLHGCMPNYCASHSNRQNAIEDGICLSELGRDRARAFARDLYIELNLRRDGNEYMEISECDCSTPEIHNDD